ncbi:MAG TPA: hypothetical protein VG370_00785 [Chloroflexota bacterium]|nr:hypothetical protein [Chloroflexota bacterium]
MIRRRRAEAVARRRRFDPRDDRAGAAARAQLAGVPQALGWSPVGPGG